MIVEWRISGGRAPYSLLIDGRKHRGREGRVAMPCGDLRNDGRIPGRGIASGLVHHQAFALDADGRTASAVASTYVIAKANYLRDSRMRGGQTYRFLNLLLTPPQGLDFDLRKIGRIEAECPPSEPDDPPFACQGIYTIWSLGGAVDVDIGDRSGRIIRTRVLPSAIANDPGVQIDTVAEAEALVQQLVDSQGQPPVLPPEGRYQPLPLYVRAAADPVCIAHRDYPHTARVFVVWGGGD